MVIKRNVIFTPNGEERTLHIYLPEGYDWTEDRYPVMYFFDGHNLYFNKDATYGKSWGLKEFLDRWEKPMIVVGIECSHVGNNRLTEYCPYHINNRFYGNMYGTGIETLKWMTEELKPVIDREYRTYSFREATGIAGSSMGGLMSLYAAIAFNRYFSKAACLSSAIYSCDRQLLRDIERCQMSRDTRVYLSWGEQENRMAGKNYELAERLERKGIRTRVHMEPGGGHCEADWEKQNDRYMGFLWLDR